MRRHILHIIFCLVAFLAFSMTVDAMTKDIADAEYKKANYQQAIKDYEELLKDGVSSELYYNLGNSYYRINNITRALLNYERASMLDPGNKDIRFNLQFVRNKTIDKSADDDEMFFVTWYKTIVNFTSVDGWAKTSVVSIVFALLLLLIYLFCENVNLRKIGFFGSLAFIACFIFSILFAYQQKYYFENRCGAIVTSPVVNVKKTPSTATADEFIIHEGTKVYITDRGMKGWIGVRLPDGREGWILKDKVEEI
ncbi:MAG: tetratricopeptide repeat protein [Prevotella sp.]|jgi:tetratricopeptide (TPR) repeat protein|nr:tetratricopeptide repeat protein [Prevotella sp.]MBP8038481.1 tetratricopeptide repeat protein [Prevotella sp.]MBP8756976.1 tetratricopeptide repeat protein [Prevotella sp.]